MQGGNGLVYIAVALLSWAVAQFLKYLINSIRTKDFKNTRPLHDSGRMPSAHSATTVGLATIVGLEYGVNSALFAIAAVLAFIVMYDAVKVRRVVGEQGTLLRSIASKVMAKNARVLRVAEGHKPVEVLVGACIGAAIAVIFYLASMNL